MSRKFFTKKNEPSNLIHSKAISEIMAEQRRHDIVRIAYVKGKRVNNPKSFANFLRRIFN